MLNTHMTVVTLGIVMPAPADAGLNLDDKGILDRSDRPYTDKFFI
jgi:hypothetical protein